ncbi:hypothetical protein C4D60_Mb06t04290 [Musa balbisiana]|uniref:Uncharacterized protein n=1 Tax=Musa balbisiana TaxID=52838 RepID=A0A4S8IKL3_MUSBA|nr:hypothetical protein C4D60_Mb06t04290 [Musa balbisiana]
MDTTKLAVLLLALVCCTLSAATTPCNPETPSRRHPRHTSLPRRCLPTPFCPWDTLKLAPALDFLGDGGLLVGAAPSRGKSLTDIRFSTSTSCLGRSGAMASSSSPSLSPSPKSSSVSDNADEEGKQELRGKIRGHEVAIGELEHLQPSRAVYQKSGNIFFRRSIKTAIASEQKQLDLAKSQLQKLNAI